MARLGKRERAAKRAIIEANLSAPKPEAAMMVVRGRHGGLSLIKGDAIGVSSSERLKASIARAAGGFTRFGSESTGPMSPRFGTPQKRPNVGERSSGELAAIYDAPRRQARALEAKNRESEKRWGMKAT